MATYYPKPCALCGKQIPVERFERVEPMYCSGKCGDRAHEMTRTRSRAKDAPKPISPDRRKSTIQEPRQVVPGTPPPAFSPRATPNPEKKPFDPCLRRALVRAYYTEPDPIKRKAIIERSPEIADVVFKTI